MKNLNVQSISNMILPVAAALKVDVQVYPSSELFPDAVDSVAVEVNEQVYLITNDSGTCLIEVIPGDVEDVNVSELVDVEAAIGCIVAATLRA